MPNFFLPSKIFTSILWLSVIFLWSKSVQATENECGSVSSLELLSENEDCETKYIQGASYCCPDYQCCSEEEIRSAGNPCPCAGNQKCCDGKTCCTALESGKIGKKCAEDEASFYCDLENFSELRCCENMAAAAEKVCCTEHQLNRQGRPCDIDRPCPDHMECIEPESRCYFNVSFDEREVTLFIIVFIMVAIVVIIVCIVGAICIFSHRRKSKEKESSFKPAEAKRSVNTGGRAPHGTVVQIPTVSRNVPETNYKNVPETNYRNVPQTHYTNYGFRYSAALENPEMQLYEKEPRSGTPSERMYRQSRSSTNSGTANNLPPNRDIYRKEKTLPANNFNPETPQDPNFGTVNHGYQNSHPFMGDDPGVVHRPPRYTSTPDPPPRSRSSMDPVGRNKPPWVNGPKVKSYPNSNHAARNGPRRHVVEEDDENDTLVIATDSLVINNQSTINDHPDSPEWDSIYPNRGFVSSEINVDNPHL